MKNTTLMVFIALCIFFKVESQCEATILNAVNPNVTANNDGNVNNFIALNNNEYTVLGGLISNNTYTITTENDLIGPVTEAYITIRDNNDNSVIANGFTPLTFSSVNTDVEVHFFDDSSCSLVSDLVILGLQNQSTLGNDNFNYSTYTLYPNPVLNQLSINGIYPIEELTLYNDLGQKILEIMVNDSQFKLDMNNIVSGIYFLKIKNERGFTSKKIIKL